MSEGLSGTFVTLETDNACLMTEIPMEVLLQSEAV
ncbi:hypothetical protein GGE29_004388 [Agrobacterium tumefaciens]|nr:hypothetical protein [Agrobacterium radiobacter]MBB4454428.1 hypothetical protein [Agrobacterium radiobacter]